jgi:hypothetical protein
MGPPTLFCGSINRSKAAVAGHKSMQLLFLSPFNEGKLGATLSSSLDGVLTGASSGVTACVVEVRRGSIAEEGGRNNDSIQQDVPSSSQQQ